MKNTFRGTYDVLRIRCQRDICPLWMFVAKKVGYNVSIRYSSHRCEPIVFGPASVDLIAVFYDSTFSSFKLVTGIKTMFQLVE
jgi:hypothetical protein